MTKNEFKKVFAGVIGPAHAGAAYPEFNEFGINESRIERECRFKSFDFYIFPDTGTLCIEWITQGDCHENEQLREEIRRCLRDAIGYTDPIILFLSERGDPDDSYTRYVID